MTKSVFIATPKKDYTTTDRENYRTISFLSHIIKILLRIILNRWKKKIKSKVSDVQCGFVEGRGTRDAIFIVKNLTKRATEVQQDVNECFIGKTKEFDKVRKVKKLTK